MRQHFTSSVARKDGGVLAVEFSSAGSQKTAEHKKTEYSNKFADFSDHDRHVPLTRHAFKIAIAGNTEMVKIVTFVSVNLSGQVAFVLFEVRSWRF